MTYKFYGNESADIVPAEEKFAAAGNQRNMYDILDKCWCAETCAPRLRGEWSGTNKTVGQCSITAFLVQDVYGGEVYGIPLPDGSYHCYNVVGDSLFDLTSEQFGDERLSYTMENPQSRELHFSDPGKKARYELLKARLLEQIKGK